MPRFSAIEGMRAWLAWGVVLSHINQSLGLNEMFGGHWVWAGRAGEGVFVFIVISGFVITHLVLDKHEPYPRYLLRRAFRLFPAYWIGYAIALAALPFAVASLAHMSWANDPAYTWDDLIHNWAGTTTHNAAAYIAPHALLLQGVLPDSILPFSATAVLGPAWSLTLEWQFYLVAPALVWVLASKRWRPLTVALVFAAVALFHLDVFGHFMMPSFLPGAAYMFMIGIGCRLGFRQAQQVTLPPEVALGCLVVGALFPDMLWFAVWLALYVFLLNGERWRTEPSVIASAFRAAFESKPAQYLGARSYSVYILHLPILQLLTWAMVSRGVFTQMQLFGLLLPATIIAVLIASDILYRLVERPMIKLGARLAGAQAPRDEPASAAG
ncbi:MAG: acyltransferase [Vitreimonas sp.]